MVYTEADLKGLNVKQIREILRDMHLEDYGLKKEVIARVLENLDELPEDHVKVLPANNRRELADDSSIDELADKLRLSEKSVEKLKEENFMTIGDLQLLKKDILDGFKLPVRDELTLQNYLRYSTDPNDLRALIKEKQDHPAPAATQAGSSNKAKQRRDSESDSGESDSVLAEEESEMNELPVCARDLPRPHTFVSPKIDAKGREAKPKALEISMNEFVAESMRLLQRLSGSAESSSVRIEYSEYVEFLTFKQCDYTATAVLGFDDEFRRRVKMEHLDLGNSELRRSLSDKWFHSATRLFRASDPSRFQGQGGGFRKQTRYNSGGGGGGYQTDQKSNEPCLKWNAGLCTFNPCRYSHICAICKFNNHSAQSCKRGGDSRQSGFGQQNKQ